MQESPATDLPSDEGTKMPLETKIFIIYGIRERVWAGPAIIDPISPYTTIEESLLDRLGLMPKSDSDNKASEIQHLSKGDLKKTLQVVKVDDPPGCKTVWDRFPVRLGKDWVEQNPHI